MPDERNPEIDPDEPMVYQIRIRGHLTHEWADWFGDVSIASDGSGDTILTCTVIDQAALHGLLRKVRDLGMPLISVNRIETDSPDVDR